MDFEDIFRASIRDSGINDAAKLANLLRDANIPSALWGVNAASCYGGRLCQLDIEIVINETDQARTSERLCSKGFLPPQPIDSDAHLIDFTNWRELASHHVYHDRRRLRLCTPIYEPPKQGMHSPTFCYLS